MAWGPFLLCSCQEVLLRGFQCAFFFSCSIFLKAGTVYNCSSQGWPSRHPRKANREECPYLPVWKYSAGQIRAYIPCTVLPFHVFQPSFFFFSYGFRRFLSNLPPLPFTSIFTSFSEPYQSVISVLGAKVIPGLDGNARSSLLFSAKISSPSGSIFPEKPCIS